MLAGELAARPDARWLVGPGFLDAGGHLAAPVRVAGLVHGHPENLPAAVSGVPSTDSRTQPVPSIAAGLAGSARTATMASAEAFMIVAALSVAPVMLAASC
jgi:hypothetical protein